MEFSRGNILGVALLFSRSIRHLLPVYGGWIGQFESSGLVAKAVKSVQKIVSCMCVSRSLNLASHCSLPPPCLLHRFIVRSTSSSQESNMPKAVSCLRVHDCDALSYAPSTVDVHVCIGAVSRVPLYQH